MEPNIQVAEEKQRAQLVEAAQLLFRAGVMSHNGHANMSVRIENEQSMLITSRGVIKDLNKQQLAHVTFDGKSIEGQLEPTTYEIVAMHAGVYRQRDDVKAIIHTHSPHVTSFALAHQPLPCVYEALLRFGVVEDIPVAAWAPRGSEEAVSFILEQLQAHPGIPAVLLANHGLLAFGSDPLRVAQLIVAMEEAAEVTLGARALGGEKEFPPGAFEQTRARMQQFGSQR